MSTTLTAERKQNVQEIERSPLPHNIEAEQALLGAILVNNQAFERVADLIERRHFYDPVHAHIFEAAAGLIAKGVVATPITLKSAVDGIPPLGTGMSMPQYLGRLAGAATTLINVRDYASTVTEFAAQRDIIMLGHDAISWAREGSASAAQRIDEALYSITRAGQERREVMLDAAMQQAVDSMCRAYRAGTGLAGVSTGLQSVDDITGGLEPGTLTIIAGRPAMGKTAIALNMVLSIAAKGEAAGVFSLEMSGQQLGARALSSITGVSASRMRTGRVSEDEARIVMNAAAANSKIPLVIDESGGLSIGGIATRARRMVRRHGVVALFIDYLQLIGGERGGFDNRVQQLTEVTTGLKALAKELNIPIVALSQLSRKVEERQDKRPQLADLRDSGSIEQDADTVIFVYRDEYYVKREEPDENTSEHIDWRRKMRECAGRAEAITAKNRFGATATADLLFDAQTTTFRDAPARAA